MCRSIGPIFPILRIRFKGYDVAFAPMFQLDTVCKSLRKNVDEEIWFQYTGTSVPEVPQERHSFAKQLIETFTWEEIRLYVHSVDYPETHLKDIWEGRESNATFDFDVLRVPCRLYKYTKSDEENMRRLLKCGLLELNSPLHFNDPWDCNYTPEVKKLLKDVGISCFSEKDSNVLMYSHYAYGPAGGHAGICVEFDPYKIHTLWSENDSDEIKADWRRVFYYPALPSFDSNSQKAVIATCKNRIWQYESEYRLFAVKKDTPQGPGIYQFNREAITAVLFGCRFDGHIIDIDKVKRWLSDVPNVTYKRALEPNGSFEITYEDCNN